MNVCKVPELDDISIMCARCLADLLPPGIGRGSHTFLSKVSCSIVLFYAGSLWKEPGAPGAPKVLPPELELASIDRIGAVRRRRADGFQNIAC